jgi:hypothetical protein
LFAIHSPFSKIHPISHLSPLRSHHPNQAVLATPDSVITAASPTFAERRAVAFRKMSGCSCIWKGLSFSGRAQIPKKAVIAKSKMAMLLKTSAARRTGC